MMSSAESIEVAVCYALPGRQWLLTVRVPDGSTVRDALLRSGIGDEVPGLDVERVPLGIFSRPTTLDATLRDGDRVEIYRPLLCDPKEVRRQRAEAERPAKGGQRR